MSGFDERLHRRDPSGRFAEKAPAESLGGVDALRDHLVMSDDVAAFLTYERPEGVGPLFERVLADARRN